MTLRKAEYLERYGQASWDDQLLKNKARKIKLYTSDEGKAKLKELKAGSYQRCKEHVLDHCKTYYNANSVEIIKKTTQYTKDHPEMKKLYDAKYYSSEKGIKSRMIIHWRHVGMISDDWDKVYDIVKKTTNCQVCSGWIGEGFSNFKHLDHNHDITHRPNLRWILCPSCNGKDYWKKVLKERKAHKQTVD